MKLKSKIFLQSSLLMLLLFVAAFFVTSYSLLNEQLKKQIELAKIEAFILTQSCEKFILWHEYSEVKTLMEYVVDKNKVNEYIFILKDKKIIAHTFKKGVPKALFNLQNNAIINGDVTKFSKKNGDIFYDIVIKAEKMGIIVHYGISENEILKHIYPMLLSLACIFFVVFLVSVFLSLLFASFLTKEERKKTSELNNIRNYLSSVINSMPSILVGVDPNGQITEWNQKAIEKTGLSTEEVIGKHMDKIMPYFESKMEKVYESIKEKEKKVISKYSHLKDGKAIYEDVTIYPLIADGFEGAVIRIDDVTKEFMLQEQLNQSRKMEAIGQLAGGVAHDFNNMLGGIIGAAELLKVPEHNLDDKSLHLVKMIIDAANRTAELTSKLLAISRKKKICSSTIDVHNIIDDTFEIFNRTIDKKIKISVQKNADNSKVVGDNSTLENSILNLGLNASHAMENGGELYIGTRNIYLDKLYCNSSPFEITEGDYIEIEVRDTGCGIPIENINRIFEPFFTTKDQGKGTGLGLASVFGTINSHHGAINVYSEVGVGTVFHIYLPCSDEIIKPKNTEDISFKGSGLVLLVDDEEIIRITCKHMLESMGFTVILAKNGLEAVEIFQEKFSKISLVIMDMIMPEMNGREAFYKMKKIDKKCKIIIASGFTKDENLDEMKKEGLEGFIQKPFSYNELTKLIANTGNKKK